MDVNIGAIGWLLLGNMWIERKVLSMKSNYASAKWGLILHKNFPNHLEHSRNILKGQRGLKCDNLRILACLVGSNWHAQGYVHGFTIKEMKFSFGEIKIISPRFTSPFSFHYDIIQTPRTLILREFQLFKLIMQK